MTPERLLKKQTHSVPKGEKGVYFLQTGSFSHFPTDRYLAKIRDQGFSYKVVNNHAGYKVLVGPFSSEKEARTVLSTIKREISKGAFLLQDKSI